MLIFEEFRFVVLEIFKEAAADKIWIWFWLCFIGCSMVSLNIDGLKGVAVEKVGEWKKARRVGE